MYRGFLLLPLLVLDYILQMSLNVPVMVTAEEMANSAQYMEPSDCGPFKVVGNFLHTVAGGEFLQDQKYSIQKVCIIITYLVPLYVFNDIVLWTDKDYVITVFCFEGGAHITW